ncbi:MAG: hypothetical protein ACLQDV_11545 [Candidatus Binataceae bacterium]
MSPPIERAADFIWRNARLLERAMFAHEFLDGAADAVVAALSAYRNPDGGFGNALEADIRAPGSTPLVCENALRALCDVQIRDARIATGTCDFLTSVADAEGRVEIVSPHILEYPRAAHWNDPSFGVDSPNPTAGLVGLLRYQQIDHPWIARAAEWCERRLDRPLHDAHEVACALRFYEYAPDRKRAEIAAVKIARDADRTRWFAKDPSSNNYGVTPLQLCPRPDAIARPAFAEDLIEAHLESLAARQQDDGGWPITWAAPSPAAELEWRGFLTFEALKCLRAWNRI